MTSCATIEEKRTLYVQAHFGELKRFAANPRQEFTRFAIGLLLILATIPAMGLFFALTSRMGLDYQFIASHLAMNIAAHAACFALILGVLWFRICPSDANSVALKTVMAGFAASSLIELIALFAAH